MSSKPSMSPSPRKSVDEDCPSSSSELPDSDSDSESITSASAMTMASEGVSCTRVGNIVTVQIGLKRMKKMIEGVRDREIQESIVQCRRDGYRVQNRSSGDRDVVHWCPICDTKQSNLFEHLENPPTKGKAALERANVDVERAKTFIKAQNSGGMRGPVYPEPVVQDILDAGQDRAKITHIITNLLSNFGVGNVHSPAEAAGVYDMHNCFKRDWVKPEDPLNDLLNDKAGEDDNDDHC